MILAALPCEERPLRAQVVFKSTQEDNQMKRIILASACIMALATGGAFAQTHPLPAHPAKLHPAKATSVLPREAPRPRA